MDDQTTRSEAANARLPDSPIPFLPLRRAVLLPGNVARLPLGRERSVALSRAVDVGDLVAVGAQRDPSVENPDLPDLQPLATLARVVRIVRTSGGHPALVLLGLKRFELLEIAEREPFMRVLGGRADEPVTDAEEARALADALQRELSALDPKGEGNLAQVCSAYDSDTPPGFFADRLGGALGLGLDQEVHVLLTRDVLERLRLVTRLAGDQIASRELKRRIDEEVRKELQKMQRDHVLRQQIKAIRKELGEAPESDQDELIERLKALELPEDVRKAVDRDIRKLQTLQSGMAEYHVVRTFLEWVVELPWVARAEGELDVDAIAAQLDADHHGLEDVKKRILEHMAVLQVTGKARGTLLCLVGPPGVGKTSLGQSVADAIGRPLVRIALGGVRDEAEIRGHRRTYIGARPGRLIAGLRKAAVKNPVILLDEVDKLGQSWNGTPEHALLEVLDPEQNSRFTDHYMELPFDLSEVLFICTANDLSKISGPLRDRLEVVEVQGYTQEEKAQIARKHLIPKLLSDHGLDDAELAMDAHALDAIIKTYTREAGVRQLKRELTRVARALTLEVARGADVARFTVTPEDLDRLLGKAKFIDKVRERTALPGVAVGLAWTPVGGDVLFVETSRMAGTGKLEITGQLGDVMKESARAALTYVRSNADVLRLEPNLLEGHDVHIHVPAGAVPKDGPSAGVTIFTALTSLLTGRRVRPDTAMTGECTLRGRVLPVGGIKAKVLAAHRLGLTRVILPERNERDLIDIPDDVREQMEFVPATTMAEVLEAALEPAPDDGPDLSALAGADLVIHHGSTTL